MTIAATLQYGNNKNTAGQTMASSSLTIPANSIIWLFDWSRDTGTPAAPTVSDTAGLSWSACDGAIIATNSRYKLFRAEWAAGGSTVITQDWGASVTCQGMHVVTTDNTDSTTPTVQNPKGNGNANNSLVTLSGFASTDNATLLFGIVASNVVASLAAGTGFTLLDAVNAVNTVNVTGYCEFRNDNDTTATATWTGSQAWGAIAVEVKHTPTSAAIPRIMHHLRQQGIA